MEAEIEFEAAIAPGLQASVETGFPEFLFGFGRQSAQLDTALGPFGDNGRQFARSIRSGVRFSVIRSD